MKIFKGLTFWGKVLVLIHPGIWFVVIIELIKRKGRSK